MPAGQSRAPWPQRIVEQGRHDDLLAQGGLYAQLWKRQSGGFLDLDAD